MEIKKLPLEVQSKLESGIVITDAVQCVLELVHNSLDAEATAIAVRVDLKNYQIQVVDNGKGIRKDDLELVGKKFMTSKYPSLENINTSIVTYGYKGQAISSLLDFCRLLKIETKSDIDGPSFVKIFEMEKTLPVEESNSDRPGTGTTVTVEDFMCTMPVRRKRINEVFDMEEMKTQLQYLAIIHNNVCFTLRNESKGLILFQTLPTTSLLDSITNIFGKKISKSLRPLTYQDQNYKISGFVSIKPQRQNNVQLLYVNKRIITKGVIHKFVNNLLKEYFRNMNLYNNSTSEELFLKKPKNSTYNVFILEIRCSHSFYELFTNMKKNTVEFKKWKEVLKCVHKAIRYVFKFEVKSSDSSTSTHCEKEKSVNYKNTNNNFGTSFLENAVRGAHVNRFLNKKKDLARQKKNKSKKKSVLETITDKTKEALVENSAQTNISVSVDHTNDSLESPIPRRKLKQSLAKPKSNSNSISKETLPKNLNLSIQTSNFNPNPKEFQNNISNQSVIEFYEWFKSKYATDANAFNLYNDFKKNQKQKEHLQNALTEFRSPVFEVKQIKKKKGPSRKFENFYLQKSKETTNGDLNDISICYSSDVIVQNHKNRKFLNSNDFDTQNCKCNTFLNPMTHLTNPVSENSITRHIRYRKIQHRINPYNRTLRNSNIQYSNHPCNTSGSLYYLNHEMLLNQDSTNFYPLHNDFSIRQNNDDCSRYYYNSRIRKYNEFCSQKNHYTVNNNNSYIERYSKPEFRQHKGNQQDEKNFQYVHQYYNPYNQGFRFQQSKNCRNRNSKTSETSYRTDQYPPTINKKRQFHNTDKKYLNVKYNHLQNAEHTRRTLFKPPILPDRQPNRVGGLYHPLPSPASSEIFFANLIKLRNMSDSLADLSIYEERCHNITHTWASHYQHVEQRGNHYSLYQGSFGEDFEYDKANSIGFKDGRNLDICYGVNSTQLKVIDSSLEQLGGVVFNKFEDNEILNIKPNLNKNRLKISDADSMSAKRFVLRDMKQPGNGLWNRENRRSLGKKRLKVINISPVQSKGINFHNVEMQTDLPEKGKPIERVDATVQTSDNIANNTLKVIEMLESHDLDNESNSKREQNNHGSDNNHNFSQEVPDPDFWNYPTPKNTFGVSPSVDENAQKSFVFLPNEKTPNKLFCCEQESCKNPSTPKKQVFIDTNTRGMSTPKENCLGFDTSKSKEENSKPFSAEKVGHKSNSLNFNFKNSVPTKNESVHCSSTLTNQNHLNRPLTVKYIHSLGNSFCISATESSPSNDNQTDSKKNSDENFLEPSYTCGMSVNFVTNNMKDLKTPKNGSEITDAMPKGGDHPELNEELSNVERNNLSKVSELHNSNEYCSTPKSTTVTHPSLGNETQKGFNQEENNFSTGALIAEEQKSGNGHSTFDNTGKASAPIIGTVQKNRNSTANENTSDIHHICAKGGTFIDDDTQKNSAKELSTFGESSLIGCVLLIGEGSSNDQKTTENHTKSRNDKGTHILSRCSTFKESQNKTSGYSGNSVFNFWENGSIPQPSKKLPSLTNIEKATTNLKSNLQTSTKEKTSSSELLCCGQKSTRKRKRSSNDSISKETETVAALWTDCLSDFGTSNGSKHPSSCGTELPKTIPVEDLPEENFNPPTHPTTADTFCLSERYDFVPKGLSPKGFTSSELPKMTDLNPREKNRIKSTIPNERKESLASVKWEDERTGGSTKPKIPDEILDEMREKAERNLIYYENEILSASMSYCAIKVHNLLHSFAFTKELLSSCEVLGQLDKKFIVAKMEVTVTKKMVLIAVLDQHAVDERIRLEEITNDYVGADGRLISTSLSPPIAYTVEESVAQFVSILEEKLWEFGLKLKVTDEKTITVEELPKFLLDKSEKNIKNKKESKDTLGEMIQILIINIVEEMTETRGGISKIPKFIHNAFCLEACRGAIKFNKKLKITRMREIINKLKNCALPFQCAHGRPSVIPIIDLQDFHSVMPEEEKINYEKLKKFMRERNQSQDIIQNSS